MAARQLPYRQGRLAAAPPAGVGLQQFIGDVVAGGTARAGFRAQRWAASARSPPCLPPVSKPAGTGCRRTGPPRSTTHDAPSVHPGRRLSATSRQAPVRSGAAARSPRSASCCGSPTTAGGRRRHRISLARDLPSCAGERPGVHTRRRGCLPSGAAPAAACSIAVRLFQWRPATRCGARKQNPATPAAKAAPSCAAHQPLNASATPASCQRRRAPGRWLSVSCGRRPLQHDRSSRDRYASAAPDSGPAKGPARGQAGALAGGAERGRGAQRIAVIRERGRPAAAQHMAEAERGDAPELVAQGIRLRGRGEVEFADPHWIVLRAFLIGRGDPQPRHMRGPEAVRAMHILRVGSVAVRDPRDPVAACRVISNGMAWNPGRRISLWFLVEL